MKPKAKGERGGKLTRRPFTGAWIETQKQEQWPE